MSARTAVALFLCALAWSRSGAAETGSQAELADPGKLLALEDFPAVVRSALVRQSFEFVLVI